MGLRNRRGKVSQAGDMRRRLTAAGTDPLDAYSRRTEIARGGSSVVYRAWEDRFGRWVVIKRLEIGVGGTSRSQFERECGAIGALAGHPNIVTVHAAWATTEGTAYIVMEYLPDGTLAEQIRTEPLDWQQTAAVGINLGGALASAHRAGVLHLDVKPENVFVRRDYDAVKLGDFGIASVAGRTEPLQAMIAGTLLHISPERLQDQPPTPASDVYSLGSTLFTVLAGAPPFGRADENPAVVMARLVGDRRPPTPDLRDRGVPVALCRVIEQALSPDPQDRPTAAELAKQLQLVQESEGLSATPLMITASATVEPPPPPARVELSGDTLPPAQTPLDDPLPTETLELTVEVPPAPAAEVEPEVTPPISTAPIARPERARRPRPRREVLNRVPQRVIVVVLGLVIATAGTAAFSAIPDPEEPPFVAGRVDAMAVDRRTGVTYFSDESGNRVYRLAASGKVTPFAGSGDRGFGGDGGRATEALLNGPYGLAVDRHGNVFIADELNGRVRKVTPDGMITSLVVTGGDGWPGDGRDATEPNLDSPRTIAVDHNGNLFVAEPNNRLIRRIGPDGKAVTLAGGGRKPLAEAVVGTDVSLSGVSGATVDGAGNLYFTTQQHRLVKIDPDGRMTRLAGTGVSGDAGDSGKATEAQLASPSGVAVDNRGQVFVAVESAVRKIGVDGTISTVAGGGKPGTIGEGGKAAGAEVLAPRALALDQLANLLIADAGNGRIQKLWPTGEITTLARTERGEPTATTSRTVLPSVTGPTTTTTHMPNYGELFREDFTRANRGWSIRDTGGWKSEYADDGYRVTVQKANAARLTAPLGSLLSPTGPIPNGALTVEATAHFMPAASFVFASVFCRATNESAGYRASLRGDGYWAITRYAVAGQDGTVMAFSQTRPEFASFQAGGPNALRLDCLGGTSAGPVTVVFYVNGSKVGEVHDAEGLPPGQVSVGASLSSNAPMDSAAVLFDDVVVTRRPPPE